MNKFGRATILGTLLALATSVAAVPYAPKPPLNDLGRQMAEAMKKAGQKPPDMIPDADTVTLPAYPGSYVVMTMIPQDHNGMLPAITLVSTDPVGKVFDWYKAHIHRKGWTSDPKMHMVRAPGWKLYKTAVTPHVWIRKMKKGGGLLTLYDVPGAQTVITVTYKPRGTSGKSK